MPAKFALREMQLLFHVSGFYTPLAVCYFKWAPVCGSKFLCILYAIFFNIGVNFFDLK